MKKILSIALVLSMLMGLALFSCTSGNGEKETTTTEETNENVPLTAELTIAGKALSEFKIIYAKAEYAKQGPKTFNTEWDFYKLTAKEIQNKIYDITGVALEVKQDEKTEEGANEILVGPTNRGQSDVYDSMSVYKCRSFVSLGKLSIGGGYNASSLVNNLKTSYTWGATYHAFEYLEDYIAKQVKAGKKTVDLVDGFEIENDVDLITVACVGDSITEGDKASDWNVTSWPPVLQRFLWKDYVVLNYGKCGKTMRNNMDRRYNTCEQFYSAQSHAKYFDMALIMLGTNDFLNDSSFSAADDKNFKDSALEIVEMLSAENKDIKLTVMNCPMYYGSNTKSFAHVRELQDELYSTLKTKGYDTEFFDMYTFTDKNVTVKNYPDKLHPNDKGYSIIGEKLSTVVPAVWQGIWDSEKQDVSLSLPEVPAEDLVRYDRKLWEITA